MSPPTLILSALGMVRRDLVGVVLGIVAERVGLLVGVTAGWIAMKGSGESALEFPSSTTSIEVSTGIKLCF